MGEWYRADGGTNMGRKAHCWRYPSGMSQECRLLDRKDSVLLLVDLQSRLLDGIHSKEALHRNCALLACAARQCAVPVIATTQNAQRLGALDTEIASSLPPATPVHDKLTFSAARASDVAKTIAATGRNRIVLCGIETHVCVSQTAFDLLDMGLEVHVAVDAVSSRTFERHKLGMERIRDRGAMPAAAEAVVFEWLETAECPEFRALLPRIKDIEGIGQPS